MTNYGTPDVRIGIDIDSTLHHYWEQLREVVRRRHGIDMPYEDQVDWHVRTLPQEVLFECVMETHTEEFVLAAEPYEGAVETVRRWHEQGHFIHITSHRPVEAHDHTARWLDQIGLPHDELYCSWDKISRCVEIGIDILIDDSPVNLRRAADAGLTAATIEHPWNRELIEADPRIVHAPDWPGLERALALTLGSEERAA